MRPDHPAVGVLALGLARRLGLPDTALLPDDAPAAGAEPRRIEVARQGVAEAEVLALPWATVVAGPAWFTRACRGVPAEALGVESALLRTAVRAAAGEAVRSRGEFTLYAAEEPPPVDPSRTVAVSDDPAHVHAVVAQAPADDVAGRVSPPGSPRSRSFPTTARDGRSKPRWRRRGIA